MLKGKKATPLLLMALVALMFVAALAVDTRSTYAVVFSRTYTLDADFDEGTLINVVHDPSDQLQLDETTEAFNFIWVAVSTKGTAVKIDTQTGAVLGEYRTTPQNQSLGNPSRTTVDQDGSVWVANRNNVSNNLGTVIHIGLEENGQCEDRHDGAGGGPDGIIQTSTGLGDVRGWTDASGPRSVATALDECIVHYTQVNSRGTRHVSVDANNDVWVSGTSLRNFDLLKGGRYDVVNSGTIIRSETSVGFGGYGGLIDGNNVIWSARGLLRWDVSNTLTGANGDPAGNDIGPPILGRNWSGQGLDSYGLCIDSQGNVWNTQLSGNLIRKYAPDGTHLGAFAHGNANSQGCVVDGNDDVWVAHSLFSGNNTVGHLLNDGTFVGNVVLSDANVGPTGVAVDGAGKIWATGYNSQKVYRIDPTLGAVGGGGATIGAEDFVSVNLGGRLYNYSDMTGSTLTGAPDNGTWTVIFDSEQAGTEWGTVSWNSLEPGDSSITVTAASSSDGVNFGAPEAVTDSVDLTVADGRHLRVTVSFARGSSPILYDLTIEAVVPEGQININKVDGVTGAPLADSCFQVSDAAQTPLFQVCDNDFQGPPDLNPVCVPDGVCEDEDPAAGSMQVTVDAGTYSVIETKAPPDYNPKAGKLPCTVPGGGKCQLTVSNQPLFNGLKVGGLAVDLDADAPRTPLDTAQSSGPSAGVLASTIAGMAALAVTLTGAAWYARRRWAR